MGTKVTNPKSVLVSSPGEDVGYRNNFSCDIQRYEMIRPMESFRAIKIDKKCKHL
jgi:hypothetical protein